MAARGRGMLPALKRVGLLVPHCSVVDSVRQAWEASSVMSGVALEVRD